jgi:hypothetical protein
VSEARRPELEELCRRLVNASRGSLTSVIICTEELEILAHNPVMEVDQDAVAIAVGNISAFRYMTQKYGFKPPRRIDVDFGGERLIIKPLGSLILVAKTSAKPNLGLVDLILEQVKL